MTTTRSTVGPTLFRTLILSCLLCVLNTPMKGADQKEVIYNCHDLSGWRKPTGTWEPVRSVAIDHAVPEQFIVTSGVGALLNSPTNHSVDLVTDGDFGDVEVHIEFAIARHSNSGVYLMGRYEVQIFDSYGVAKDKYPGIECGGIYPRWIDGKEFEGHSPLVNASKPAGAWQSFDITFKAPRFDANGKKISNAQFVKVLLNGKVVQEKVEVNGPTRGAVAEDERASAPLRLQGDHGPVAFRNIRIKPVALD